MVESHSFNLRLFTVKLVDVRKFRNFRVPVRHIPFEEN